MNTRLTALSQAVRNAFDKVFRKAVPDAFSETVAAGGAQWRSFAPAAAQRVLNARTAIVAGAALASAAYLLWSHPPLHQVEAGVVGLRANQLTGTVDQFRDGAVWVLPGLHQMRIVSLRDRVYRPTQSAKAGGEAPFQSIEGMSIGVDLTVRYAIDPARAALLARSLPADIDAEVVQPSVQGVIYKVFTRYTVREIFSTQRAQIQAAIEAELKTRLAADGIVLRSVQMGKVDLPADYRHGMDKLLAEELETEKMRYTLALKEKRVLETELDAKAAKVRREIGAQAAASEQVIAAKAQEEAMKHVLPFKQKQIEQRQFEAEAEKQSRVKAAEGSAQARRIEAAGEADSRRNLADAEAYRMERVGKIASEQLARDGALISKHPLLIHKTMADKLSDKIAVIIAAPGSGGGFIGANLLGGLPKPAVEAGDEAVAPKEGG